MVRPGGAERVRGAAVTGDMASVVDRMLAAYSAAALLTVLPVAIALWGVTEAWWLAVFGGGLVVSAAWMNVLASRRRAIGGAAGVYAALVPLGLGAQHWGIHENGVTQPGVMSGAVGVAVVCAGVWRGGRVAVGYAGVTAVLLVVARTGPRGGGADPLFAVCEAVFSVGAGLSILAVGLGMMEAARAADVLAERVRQREVDLAVEQEIAAVRAQLDQVIHDDVMTTLTAAPRTEDAESLAALVRLATSTLRTIDELDRPSDAGERVPFAVLRLLLAQTCARVSPSIVVRDEAGLRGGGRVATAAAEAGVSAVREALRNARRHAGATRIEVVLTAGTDATGADELRVRVQDDGCGFAPEELPAGRLGVRVSMGQALDRTGLQHRLTSTPGTGTVFELVWAGEPEAGLPLPDDAEGGSLPAEFPVRRLMSVVWAATLGMIGIGLVLLPREDDVGWSLAAMVLLCGLVGLVLHTGTRLLLPAWACAVAVVLTLATSLAMAPVVPVVTDPSVLAWQLFPLQLVLVVLVLRRRRGTAAAALVAVVGGNLLWWSGGGLGVPTALVVNFGVVTFFVMALLVGAMLARIARRQQILRAYERAAIDDAVRGSIASLQRALWASDLRSRAREVVRRLATLTAPPPTELVTDALLLEATLREELVARNLVNEELSSLTDSARRRGVEVRIVDSRETKASGVLARAVNAEVRATLASRGLARLVVRLAPDPTGDDVGLPQGPGPAASVMAQSDSDTTLTRIGQDGERDSRSARRR